MKLHGLNILLFIFYTNNFYSQDNQKKNWNSKEEIFSQLNYYRTQKNYDSSIFYVDELIKCEKEKQITGKIIGAYFEKIGTYHGFNKPVQAFRVMLNVENTYCAAPNDKDCKNCNKIFRQLIDVMVVIEDYQQALNYSRQICKDEHYIRDQYEKAKLYTSLEMDDSALNITAECIRLQLKTTDSSKIITAYNNHGIIARKVQEYDKAISAFKSALKIADVTGNVIKATIQGNLGACYYKKGKLELAYSLLELDSKGNLELGDLTSYSNSEILLAEIDIEKKNYRKAINRLESLLTVNKSVLRFRQENQILKLLIKSLRLTEKAYQLIYYTNKWHELNKKRFQEKTIYHQQLVKQFSENSFLQATQQMKTEKQLMDQKIVVLKSEEDKNRLRIWLSIVGFLIIIVIILFFFWKFRIVQSKKAIVKETQLSLVKKEQELIETELTSKKKDLTNVLNNLTYNRKFIDEVLKKLKELKDQPKDKTSESISLLIREFNSYKSTDDNVKVLQTNIEQVKSSFYSKLSEKFPLLTVNERELCGFFLLKLSSKDIANIKNITPGAVKKARHRIRKKLPIQENQKIIDFLNLI